MCVIVTVLKLLLCFFSVLGVGPPLFTLSEPNF
jgi:hypothetical protein